MSRIALKANASGSGVFTVESPNSDTDRTLNLPDKSGTVHVGEGIVDNADATAITINSSEQVGIGTANPSDKLHVYGGASGASAHSYTQLHVEHSSHAAIQLSSPNTTESAIFFSDPQSNSAGGVGYYHAEDFMYLRANGATRLRVDSDGIKFAADTAAANALDDYEEGTWTPSYSTTSGSFSAITYSYQQGWFTKVGNHVTAGGRIILSAYTQGTASGNIFISLPFTVKAAYFSGTIMPLGGWTSYVPNTCYANPSNANLFVMGSDWGSSGAVSITPNMILSTADLIFTISYTT